jgi:hypothetical protein
MLEIGCSGKTAMYKYLDRNDEMPLVFQEVVRVESYNAPLVGLRNVGENDVHHPD